MTKAVLRYPDKGWYAIQCPACDQEHLYAVGTPFSNGHQWTFNEDLFNPTFLPSMNITWGMHPDPPRRCHFYVRNGRIEYCSDCTHEFAGKVIELPKYDNDDERT